MQPPVIQATELSRRYGKRWALARLSVEVPKGERLLVVGSNGSGKTTLLRLLSTLLQPSLGELRLFGMDPLRQSHAVRARLALLTHLPQLYEDLSGPENLRVLGRLLKQEAPVDALLERVGLEKRDDPVRGYSAGMRKRLAFARVLLQKPELVLLDEPYGQLDPSGFHFVDELIAELASNGATVVMASHLVERAGRLADRALLLEHGQERWRGPADQIAKAWGVLHGRAA